MSGLGKLFRSSKPSEPIQNPPVSDNVSTDFWWMTRAKAEIGQHEVPGSKDNPRINEYLKATTLDGDYIHDATPWCAAFVCWVLKGGTRSAAARSFTLYGTKLDQPKYGCIAVLSRDGGGHVGFVISSTDDSVTLLGGNQSDSVRLATFPRDRVISWRWPV